MEALCAEAPSCWKTQLLRMDIHIGSSSWIIFKYAFPFALFSEEQWEVPPRPCAVIQPRPLRSKIASLWEHGSECCDVHPPVVSRKRRNSKIVWTMIHRWMSLSTNLNTVEQMYNCHKYFLVSVSAFSLAICLKTAINLKSSLNCSPVYLRISQEIEILFLLTWW